MAEKTNHWNDIYKKEGTGYQYYNILEPHKDMPRMAEVFRKKGVEKVLDLGCGAGRNLVYLASRGFKAYGMDIAPEGLKIIRENLSKAGLDSELRRGDVYERLPYPDGFFDAVVSVQTLQHNTEDKIISAIGEIKRVLRPGGLVFVTLSGRLSQGKVRLFLVKTAKKIAPNTYVPTQGNEMGLTHFIYSRERVREHFKDFTIEEMWKDDKDYYCFLGSKKR